MYGVALSASLAVLVVMLAAVTLLPALLSYLGPSVDRLRIPFLGRRLDKPEGDGDSPAARWSHAVQRRPWPFAIAGHRAPARAGGARARHAPRLPRRRQRPARHDDPPGLRPEHRGLRARHQRAARDRRRAARPVGDGPRSTPSRTAPRASRGVAFVPDPVINDAGDAAIVTVIPRGSPQDEETEELVNRLRDDVLPERARRHRHHRPRRRRDRRARGPERLHHRPHARVHHRRGRPLVPAPARGVPLTADLAEGGRS